MKKKTLAGAIAAAALMAAGSGTAWASSGEGNSVFAFFASLFGFSLESSVTSSSSIPDGCIGPRTGGGPIYCPDGSK